MRYPEISHLAIKHSNIIGCRFYLGQVWYRKFNQDFPFIKNKYKAGAP